MKSDAFLVQKPSKVRCLDRPVEGTFRLSEGYRQARRRYVSSRLFFMVMGSIVLQGPFYLKNAPLSHFFSRASHESAVIGFCSVPRDSCLARKLK